MAIMVSEVYEAFLEAGASKEKAKAAAESIPLAEQLATQQNVSELKQEIGDVKSDIKLLKWMVGVILACVAFPLLKSLLV